MRRPADAPHGWPSCSAAARAVAEAGGTIEEVLWSLWESSGLAGEWGAQAKGTGVLAEEANRALDAVVALFAAATRYVEREPDAPAARFVDEVLASELPEDSLAPRRSAETVLVTTPPALIGREFDVVVVAGLQDGVWPNLRPRGTLLHAGLLPRVVAAARAGAPLPTAETVAEARTSVRGDEFRLFALAASRARRQLVLSCTANDEEQPSMLMAYATERVRPRRRPLHLRGLVGTLRRELVATGDGEAAAALALLAEEGVPGAHPDDWYGLAEPSTTAPLVDLEGDPEALVAVSPSQIDRAEESPLGWFIDRVAAPPSGIAASIGTLVHAVVEEAGARDDGDTSIETLWASVEERWRELRFEAGWVAERERRGARRMTEGASDYLTSFRDDRKVLLGAEGRFTLVVDRVRITGTIDRVEASPDGTTVIVDLKTGSHAAHRRPDGAASAARRVPARRTGRRGAERRNARRRQARVPRQARARPRVHRACAAAVRRRGRGGVPGATRGGGPHDVGQRVRGTGRARLPLALRRLAVPRAPRAGGVRMSLTALQIASRLGLHPPTAEQQAVIEADPHGASIVVAGAGSGKTETMANRVVWMLANGHVGVPEVLGLTFTRKAAGELAERVRERVGQLVAEGIAEVELDPLESAAVGTYNAFASSIYREHAMLIGREPDAAVLGEASAWMLARSVASASADPRLVELDASLDRVTGAVLALSRALAENVADSRDVQAFARDFLAMEGLPIEAPRKRTDFESFTSALGVVGALPPLLDLADAYAAAKRERGYVEFSDQVALALAICERHPEVVAAHRERARTVLLDEYQDTSVVQTRLLATLFRGHSVMAVGDPDQSIYGWRGASAANLARFSNDFADAGTAAGVYDLSTSWRNPGCRPRCRQRDHRAPRRGDPEGAAGPGSVRRRRTRRDRLGRDDRGGGRARRPLVRRRGSAPRAIAPLAAARCSAAPSRTSASSPRHCARTACRCTCSASPACSTSR